MKTTLKLMCTALVGLSLPVTAQADGHGEKLCLEAGPQTPRDISNGYGLEDVTFPMVPPSSEMNLCNIHAHTPAEHKGPGFNIAVRNGG